MFQRGRTAGLTLNFASKKGLERVSFFSFSVSFSYMCWCAKCLCVQQLWYPLSKTLAEKAAWEFAKESGLDVVVVNPGTVMGPIISPRLNASMLMLLRLLQGRDTNG